jgi:spore germination protein YaaH
MKKKKLKVYLRIVIVFLLTVLVYDVASSMDQLNKTKVFTFHVSWDDNSEVSLRKNIEKMDVVIPDWFRLNEDLTVRSDNQVEIDNFLKENNVKNMPLINNYNNGIWNGGWVHKLISTKESRSKHIENLLSLVKSGEYYGINIDYENIDHSDKDSYINFIKELSEKFHSNGYYISVDLDPSLNEVLNYEELSNYIDYMIIMGYDKHYSTGTPGPIAPQKWFENQINRLENIPREKLVIALGNYGYNWTLNSNEAAESLTFSEVIYIADQKKLKVRWSLDEFNPHYTYKEGQEQHIVWFLDAVTLYNQLKYSVEMGITNVALWRLGSEDSGIWDYIDKAKYNETDLDTLKVIKETFPMTYLERKEVIKYNSSIEEGTRKIRVDKEGFIINENYTSYPRH